MNMHTMIVLGHATKDAEKLTTKTKATFAKFSLAVNEFNSKTKTEKSTFYDVLVFGPQAETAIEKIKKGDLVTVMGKPEAEAYISKVNNEAKAQVTIAAESWKVLK